MSNPVQNPHDAFFKQLFSDQEIARDFIQQYLPSEITTLLNLDALQIRKDSFVDPDLHSQHSDILYQVDLATGQESYIYLLFEHKSYPDSKVAFQLLRYLVRIWEQDERQDLPLRPIMPIVFYHGATTWNIPTNFQSLFACPNAMQPYLPQFQYWLYDLSQYSENEIQGQIALRVNLLVLKYLQEDKPDERFLGLIDLLIELSHQQRGLDQLYTLLRYIGYGSEKLKTETFIEVIDTISEQGADDMSTVAERLIAQGREEGIEQGIEQGQRQGTLASLQRILNRRFNTPRDYLSTDLADLSLANLTILIDTCFEVKTLAEFEAKLKAISQSTNDQDK